jgi:hypothetical protein
MLKMGAFRPPQMSAEILHHITSQKTLDLSFIVTMYENLTSRYQTHVRRIFSTLSDIGSGIQTLLLDSLWDKSYFYLWTFVPCLYNVINSQREHKMYKKHLSDSFFTCLAPSEDTSTIYSSFFTVSCSLLRDIYHEVHQWISWLQNSIFPLFFETLVFPVVSDNEMRSYILPSFPPAF